RGRRRRCAGSDARLEAPLGVMGWSASALAGCRRGEHDHHGCGGQRGPYPIERASGDKLADPGERLARSSTRRRSDKLGLTGAAFRVGAQAAEGHEARGSRKHEAVSLGSLEPHLELKRGLLLESVEL